MTDHNEDAERNQNTAHSVFDLRESEIGVHCDTSPDQYYGRRFEVDRSWTVYHVFTGVPARIGGHTMIGLSQRAATDGMLSLNRHNETRRRVKASRIAGVLISSHKTEACRL